MYSKIQYATIDYLVKFMNRNNGQYDEKTLSVFAMIHLIPNFGI